MDNEGRKGEKRRFDSLLQGEVMRRKRPLHSQNTFFFFLSPGGTTHERSTGPGNEDPLLSMVHFGRWTTMGDRHGRAEQWCGVVEHAYFKHPPR